MRNPNSPADSQTRQLEVQLEVPEQDRYVAANGSIGSTATAAVFSVVPLAPPPTPDGSAAVSSVARANAVLEGALRLLQAYEKQHKNFGEIGQYESSFHNITSHHL